MSLWRAGQACAGRQGAGCGAEEVQGGGWFGVIVVDVLLTSFGQDAVHKCHKTAAQLPSMEAHWLPTVFDVSCRICSLHFVHFRRKWRWHAHCYSFEIRSRIVRACEPAPLGWRSSGGHGALEGFEGRVSGIYLRNTSTHTRGVCTHRAFWGLHPCITILANTRTFDR